MNAMSAVLIFLRRMSSGGHLWSLQPIFKEGQSRLSYAFNYMVLYLHDNFAVPLNQLERFTHHFATWAAANEAVGCLIPGTIGYDCTLCISILPDKI